MGVRQDAPQQEIPVQRHLRIDARVGVAGRDVQPAVDERRADQRRLGRRLREDEADLRAVGRRLPGGRVMHLENDR